MATVRDLEENEAFGFLFQYISGDNRTKQEIRMTAPVITSQKIEMTTPVISTSNCMAFILPFRYSLKTAPEPLNPNIRLKQIDERKLAVIRFRGRTMESDVTKKTKLLLATLNKKNIKTDGTPFLMRYNPPFIPGFLRRNEIGIKIKD
jgi:hypothetical protein